MAVRSGDLFGGDTKDISVATCSLPLSDVIVRSASSFRGWRAKKIFASAHSPNDLRRRPHINYVPITYVIMANPFARRMKVGGRPCVRVFTLCSSRARRQGRVDLQVVYVNKEVIMPFLLFLY
jgi:hypothetical protein